MNNIKNKIISRISSTPFGKDNSKMKGVDRMAKDLHDLLISDDEIRRYFISLPVRVQMTIHHENDRIRTEQQLRDYVAHMTKRGSEHP